MRKLFFIFALTSNFLLASQNQSYINEDREPCNVFVPDKIPLFGDLHVHTTLSLDANTQGTLNTPDDAYRYAKGQKLFLQPYNQDKSSSRSSKLRQALDFAAVTDHAELLGEVRLCLDPQSSKYNSFQCRAYKSFPKLSYFFMNAKASMRKPLGICGDGREVCLDAAEKP